MRFWQKLILRLLYLTPIGYLLSLLFLMKGERTPGIYVVLERYSPVSAKVKKNPTFFERINWFINGFFLLTEAWLAFKYAPESGLEEWVGSFAFVAFIFGAVSLVSAIFPRISWNRDIF